MDENDHETTTEVHGSVPLTAPVTTHSDPFRRPRRADPGRPVVPGQPRRGGRDPGRPRTVLRGVTARATTGRAAPAAGPAGAFRPATPLGPPFGGSTPLPQLGPDLGPPDTIRRRLTAILALPLVAMFLLLGLEVNGRLEDHSNAAAVARGVNLAVAAGNLAHELQRERGITNGMLSGRLSLKPQLDGQRRHADQARAALDRLVRGGTDELSNRIRTAVAELDGLVGIRAGVDAQLADRETTFRYYTDRLAALDHLDLGLERSSDAAIRTGTSSLRTLAEAAEAISQERDFLTGVFYAGRFDADQYLTFTSLRGAKLAALDFFSRVADDQDEAAVQRVLATPSAAALAKLERAALRTVGVGPPQVAPDEWWNASSAVLDDLLAVQLGITEKLDRRAEEVQDQSLLTLVGFVTLITLAAVLAVLLLGSAVRSITSPLAQLVAEADDVAFHRLPKLIRHYRERQSAEPDDPAAGAGSLPGTAPVRVPRRASAEIRSLGEALQRVQSTAAQLAAEQAQQRFNTVESLANLGWRNQNLVRRQLGLITRLERDETDPDALANLFQLDHLATRMRRNAESLLLLVGKAGHRGRGTPMTIADVLRAASAEVEDYRRVNLQRLDPISISAPFVGDVTHLVAELVENGLAFSPPDTTVDVQGRRVGDDYLIVIGDRGVGMSGEDLRQANARLAGAGSYLVAPTRYLGHHVAATLARRLGAEVTLSPSPGCGITARIKLRANALVAPTGAPAVVPTAIPTPVPPLAAVGAGAGEAAVPEPPAPRPVTPALPAPSWGEAAAAEPAIPAPGGPPNQELGWFAPTGSGTPAADPAVEQALRGSDRTANGLVKRRPRVDTGQQPAPRAAVTWPAEPQEVRPADSPQHVRDVLTSLRSGIARGEAAREQGEDERNGSEQ